MQKMLQTDQAWAQSWAHWNALQVSISFYSSVCIPIFIPGEAINNDSIVLDCRYSAAFEVCSWRQEAQQASNARKEVTKKCFRYVIIFSYNLFVTTNTIYYRRLSQRSAFHLIQEN